MSSTVLVHGYISKQEEDIIMIEKEEEEKEKEKEREKGKTADDIIKDLKAQLK